MLKIKHQGITRGLIFSLGGVLVAGALSAVSVPAMASTTEELNEAKSLITEAINLRNSQVLDGADLSATSVDIPRIFALSYQEQVVADFTELRDFRERAHSDNLIYAGIDAHVDVVSSNFSENSASLEIEEKTTITYPNYPNGEAAPPTLYDVNQYVELQRSESGWSISSLTPKNPNGILPSTIVAHRTEEAKKEPAPYVGPTASPYGTSGSVAPKSGFNAVGAILYAYRWWNGRNPDFLNLGEEDCTNFTSQVMLAGGWGVVPGDKLSIASWFTTNTPYGASRTWTSARYFQAFSIVSQRVRFLPYVNDLQPGSVLQISFDGDENNPDHSMILTTKNDYYDLRVTAHSGNVKDQPIRDLANAHPKAVFWAMQT